MAAKRSSKKRTSKRKTARKKAAKKTIAKRATKKPKTRAKKQKEPAKRRQKKTVQKRAKPVKSKKVEEKKQEKKEPEPKINPIKILNNLGYEVTDDLRKAIELLERHETISENDIAEILDIKINAARKLLYRLKEWGFANYEKQKDPEKNWWYIYFWSLDTKKMLTAYTAYLKIEIEKRKRALAEEEEYAFVCRRCKLKYTYTQGLESNFTCAECNGILRELKNKKIIRELRKEIEELKEKLDEVEH